MLCGLCMKEQDEFQKLVKKIHYVNSGWHLFENVNRWLGIYSRELQNNYLNRKNLLQEKLLADFSDRVYIHHAHDAPSICIKEEYWFEGYRDACHMKKGN